MPRGEGDVGGRRAGEGNLAAGDGAGNGTDRAVDGEHAAVAVRHQGDTAGDRAVGDVQRAVLVGLQRAGARHRRPRDGAEPAVRVGLDDVAGTDVHRAGGDGGARKLDVGAATGCRYRT